MRIVGFIQFWFHLVRLRSLFFATRTCSSNAMCQPGNFYTNRSRHVRCMSKVYALKCLYMSIKSTTFLVYMTPKVKESDVSGVVVQSFSLLACQELFYTLFVCLVLFRVLLSPKRLWAQKLLHFERGSCSCVNRAPWVSVVQKLLAGNVERTCYLCVIWLWTSLIFFRAQSILVCQTGKFDYKFTRLRSNLGLCLFVMRIESIRKRLVRGSFSEVSIVRQFSVFLA